MHDLKSPTLTCVSSRITHTYTRTFLQYPSYSEFRKGKVTIYVYLLLSYFPPLSQLTMRSLSTLKSLHVHYLLDSFVELFKCEIVFSFKHLLCSARTSEHCQEHLNKEELLPQPILHHINTYCSPNAVNCIFCY